MLAIAVWDDSAFVFTRLLTVPALTSVLTFIVVHFLAIA